MIDSVTRVSERRRNVIGLEVGKIFEYFLRRKPCGEEVEHVAGANPKPANAGATAALLRIHGDAICEECHRKSPVPRNQE